MSELWLYLLQWEMGQVLSLPAAPQLQDTQVGGAWGYDFLFFPGYLSSTFLGLFAPPRSRKGIPRPLVGSRTAGDTSLGTLAAFNLELL